MQQVLVTGASGFLGGHVVRELVSQGRSVLATGRADRVDWPDGVTYCRTDLCDDAQVEGLFTGHEIGVVIHCAAYGVSYTQQDPLKAAQTNVLATIRLFQQADAAGVRPFVHVGSSFEFGHHDQDITEDTPLRPQGVYGASKAAGAMMLQQLGFRARAAPIIARVFSMFGPGEAEGKLIPLIFGAARSGKPLEMTAGTEVRDYQYVGDVARQLVFLSDLDPAAAPDLDGVNLASGVPTTICDLARRVAAHLGAEHLMKIGAIAPRGDGIARNVGDPTRINALARSQSREDLLQRTSLEQGLALMRAIEEGQEGT